MQWLEVWAPADLETFREGSFAGPAREMPPMKRQQPAMPSRIVTPINYTEAGPLLRLGEGTRAEDNYQFRSGGGGPDCICCTIASSHSPTRSGISCCPANHLRTERSLIFKRRPSSAADQPSVPISNSNRSGLAPGLILRINE